MYYDAIWDWKVFSFWWIKFSRSKIKSNSSTNSGTLHWNTTQIRQILVFALTLYLEVDLFSLKPSTIPRCTAVAPHVLHVNLRDLKRSILPNLQHRKTYTFKILQFWSILWFLVNLCRSYMRPPLQPSSHVHAHTNSHTHILTQTHTLRHLQHEGWEPYYTSVLCSCRTSMILSQILAQQKGNSNYRVATF